MLRFKSSTPGYYSLPPLHIKGPKQRRIPLITKLTL